MNRATIIAATLALLMASGTAKAKDFTEAQYDVLGSFATVKFVVKDCPMFKGNMREFILWAAETGLTLEDVDSDAASLFVMMVTMGRISEKEKRNNDPACGAWWRSYGVDGSDHPNLLLKK
jgi:hypothetical protein